MSQETYPLNSRWRAQRRPDGSGCCAANLQNLLNGVGEPHTHPAVWGCGHLDGRRCTARRRARTGGRGPNRSPSLPSASRHKWLTSLSRAAFEPAGAVALPVWRGAGTPSSVPRRRGLSLPHDAAAAHRSSVCWKRTESVSEPRPSRRLSECPPSSHLVPGRRQACFLRAQEVLRSLGGSCLCAPSEPPPRSSRSRSPCRSGTCHVSSSVL